jgi:hypothetical protein
MGEFVMRSFFGLLTCGLMGGSAMAQVPSAITGDPVPDKLAEPIRAEGNQRVNSVHIATDHGYSDKRIELETVVLGGLDHLKAR